MRAGFKKRVMRIIKNADIVIEVLDAMFFEETRNYEIEDAVRAHGKKLIFALNKSDLITKESAKRIKSVLERTASCVFVSSKEKRGSRKLREAIGKAARNKKVNVGVVGYPNTGKSSLINMLRGKKVARTSITAGFSRGEQLVRLSESIMLIDTPGVIPFGEIDEAKLALIASKSANRLKDVVGAAEKIVEFILEKNGMALGKFYKIKISRMDSAGEIVEKIAIAKRKLGAGGKPNLDVAARMVIMDWQKGNIKI